MWASSTKYMKVKCYLDTFWFIKLAVYEVQLELLGKAMTQ